MRTFSLVVLGLIVFSGVGCSSPSKPPPTPVVIDISLATVSDARFSYDSMTIETENYRQVLISQRTRANIASLELNNAIREWKDPFLDPLAIVSVRNRTWVAIQGMEQAVSDYAPTGMSFSRSGSPRSKSSLTPKAATEWHSVLKRQQEKFRAEHLRRYSRIGSTRNMVETSIDEWDAHLDEPDIASFFQNEVSVNLGKLKQIVLEFKPPRSG